jgi:hypothetical protein
MKSMSAHITPRTIFAQMRMERQAHKSTFVLLEGSSDLKRVKKVTEQSNCSYVDCFGKENVIGAIDLNLDDGHEDCIGLVDADFDRIAGLTTDIDSVVFSDFHDFDMDIICSEAVESYLSETSDLKKLTVYGGAIPFLNRLMMDIKPLSILRYVNQTRNLRYNLQGLQLHEFFDGYSICTAKMIECVSQGAFGSNNHRQLIQAEIDRLLPLDFDLLQLTNGHDLFAALGICLRNRIGSRSVPQTWRSEVEMHLRLVYSTSDFRKTQAYAKIAEWQSERGRQILK